MIRRQHQIVHFKDFSKLTCLEFDLKFLRPRREDEHFLTLDLVLPKSLEVLRLVVTWPFFNSARLLETLPAKKDEFPSLRKVLVRHWPYGQIKHRSHHIFARYNLDVRKKWIEHQRARHSKEGAPIEQSFERLKQAFESVGVVLEMEELLDVVDGHNLRANLSWDD